MALKKITGKEIICRYDMMELYVVNNSRNREIDFNQILIDELGNLIKEPGKLHRKRGDKRVRLNFKNDTEIITLLFPPDSASNDLLRIRITNLCKWEWDTHLGYIISVAALLDIHSIEYAISKAEIAFDTLSESVANKFNTSVFLKWGRPRKLFNFGKGRKRAGGSFNGRDEYMSSRLSARQSHSYKKIYKSYKCDGSKGKENFYRWELKFRRKYLKQKGIDTVDDLLRDAQDLVSGLLSFKKLDRTKLNREIRRAKDWRLAGKSVAEQYRMMERNELTRNQINRYFVEISPPDIIYTINDPDAEEIGTRDHRIGYALWGSYVAATNKLRITKGRINEDICST